MHFCMNGTLWERPGRGKRRSIWGKERNGTQIAIPEGERIVFLTTQLKSFLI